ncbi:MAG: FecR family protein [Bacteroidota bacterium]
MKNLDKHIDLIPKYLAGEANPEEIQLLYSWIELDIANKKQFEDYKKAWDFSETGLDTEVSSINIDDEWGRFNSQISSETSAKIISLEQAKKKKWPFLQIAAAIAAIFVIGAGVLYTFNTQNNELVAENSIIESNLPDGSLISLNKYSELEYSKKFNKKAREVELKGEAYFKVESNPEKPFIINTGKLKIEVIGTSFNVNAKSAKGDVEVIVETGIVRTYTKRDKSDSVMLYAGDKALFNNTKNNIQKKVNEDINYLAWKTKYLVFDEDELQNIVNTLNKAYNTQIIIKNPSLKKCTLTNKFNDQSLESILKVLEATLDIQIKKMGEVYEIDGEGGSTKNNH